jgi:predicted RNA binding protein YcfA (HicA-like mRNA interferase family)
MSKSSREVIAILKNHGWYKVGQTGSHTHYKHPTIKGKVTVPHPKKDLSLKTLKSIEDQSGMSLK